MSGPLHLFEGFGVELEYMIVDRDTLDVLPIADQLLREVAGEFVSDVEQGQITWSNELALHVIELKTTGPAATLAGLVEPFQRNVRQINQILARLGGRLMPSGMHPWMDPHSQLRLWPHDYSPVYEAFNRIFDCRGHGWANLQSVHLNLPFANDDEFGRLHAAIRVLLPLLPALAASSPVVDGRPRGTLDSRLDFYRDNARRIPSVTGGVIPEPVFTIAEYRQQILERMYADIRPLDPGGDLQDEFLNARGTIARFVRNTLEIRVLDVAECPAADLAICALIVAVLRELVEQRWSDAARQRSWQVEPLRQILLATIRDADQAGISDREYLDLFGYTGPAPVTAGQLWNHLAASVAPAWLEADPDWTTPRRTLLQQGPLARRILAAVGDRASLERIAGAYRELCQCLEDGRMFGPGDV